MPCSASEAAHLAKLLISGYPNSALTEPEYYIAQVVTIFTRYDLDLVKKAVAPSGLPFESPKFMPSAGEIEKWLKTQDDKVAVSREREQRRNRQLLARPDDPPSEGLISKARAWLDRADPKVQLLSGQKNKELTEEQKRDALESAKSAGKKISGMRLLDETLAIIKDKNNVSSSHPD